VLMTAFIAIPVAVQAGNQTYRAGLRAVDEQAHGRHSVLATVVKGSTTVPVDFDNPAYVQTQWREGTQLRTEQVISPTTVKTGESLELWLDETGAVVAAPLTAFDAKVTAVAATWIVWITIVTCWALVAFAIRGGLDRSRARSWERQLLLLAHNDDGWANRRS
jgi:hypothetical protein